MSRAAFELLLAGCGAIGSRLARVVAAGVLGRGPRSVNVTFADYERVEPENVGVAAFSPADVFRPKGETLAARHRARGGVARVLGGDVRYSLRPGLARALDAAVLCLDNPAALQDASAALWCGGRPGLPVLVLTCGGAPEDDDGGVGYLARLFVTPDRCVSCAFGEAERSAARLEVGTSCSATTAPRASAAAAEAAARGGAAILAGWLDGDRSLVGCRIQRDADDRDPWVARMPFEPSRACPVHHETRLRAPARVAALGGSIATVTVGRLAEAACAAVGEDAEIVLGRRIIPLGGLYCSRCRAFTGAPPLLLPAAQAAAPSCGCGEPSRALGGRTTVSARELLEPTLAARSLAAWGAGHGDEFRAAGRKGDALLRCSFTWDEVPS
jgi:ThiF family